jgi:hypothetical protein
MRIFVLTAIYELRVSKKNHLRDHPSGAMVKQRTLYELNWRILLSAGINLRTGAQGIFPEAHVVDVDYNDFDPAAGAERKER